jgi:non-specific protein-tyrosine kinase
MNEFQPTRRITSAAGTPPAATRDIVEMIWQRKAYLVVSLVVALALGFAYLRAVEPVYEVSARILVQPRALIVEGRPLDIADRDFLATQAQVLRSPVVVEHAMNELGLITDEALRDQALAAVIKSLSADPVQGTNVLKLRFTDPDPQHALNLVGAIINHYVEFTREETLRLLGRVGETPKIQEELWKAQVREKELRERYGPRHPEVRAVQEQIPAWEQLLRNQQTSDHELAQVQAREMIQVLEQPALASQPAWPRPSILLAVSAMVGLVVGLGLVCVADRMDQKLRSAAELKGNVDLPIVGQVPIMLLPRWADAARAGRVSCDAPDSAVAEAFRGLRTRLQLSSDWGPGKLIQIVSPREGEGKSTVTANLAFSFAQLGKRVVVVDADLRKGALHEIFDVPNHAGLTSVLRDGTPPEHVIHRSPLANVDVIGRGPHASNPAELLAQPSFDKVLHLLREQYDVVLVDTPPLLVVTDSTLLAPMADGVLMTLMFGKSLVSDAVRARELLETVGARVLGIVVNRIQQAERNGYDFSYRYYGSRSKPAAPRISGARTAKSA